MTNTSVASNVININTCIRASNWQVEKNKYLISIYIFIYTVKTLKHFSIYSVWRHSLRASMSFSNYNSSAVNWTVSGKCHIQLAMRKSGDGRYFATQLNFYTWALLICHNKCDSDVKLVMVLRFKQLHNLVRIVQWHALDSFKFDAVIINKTFSWNQNYCRL